MLDTIIDVITSNALLIAILLNQVIAIYAIGNLASKIDDMENK